MVGSIVSMFDIYFLCMSTYGPRYVRKSYLGKFPLGVKFQFYEKHFYMELSHPLRELNQVSFLAKSLEV